jgi:hypothetical protein
VPGGATKQARANLQHARTFVRTDSRPPPAVPAAEGQLHQSSKRVLLPTGTSGSNDPPGSPQEHTENQPTALRDEWAEQRPHPRPQHKPSSLRAVAGTSATHSAQARGTRPRQNPTRKLRNLCSSPGVELLRRCSEPAHQLHVNPEMLMTDSSGHFSGGALSLAKPKQSCLRRSDPSRAQGRRRRRGLQPMVTNRVCAQQLPHHNTPR